MTVIPFAVVMAYGDGFWIVSLRGAAGAIERTQAPFAAWLRESTLMLPLFLLAALAGVAVALRLFGPAPRRRGTAVATALIVAAAGTLVGIVALTASAVYDYHLETSQLAMMQAMRNMCAGVCHVGPRHANLVLQAKVVGYGSLILLASNLVLVGWVLAFRGGRVKLAGDREVKPGSRVDDLRLLLVAGLVASAAVHAAVIPEHFAEWTAAGLFFVLLTLAELAVAALVLVRRQPAVLAAAAVVSIGPLLLWLYSRTFGLPFGPDAWVPESVGMADVAACLLEVGTLVAAVLLIVGPDSLRRQALSTYVSRMAVMAVVALGAIGVAGSSLPWFDVLAGEQAMTFITHT